MQKSKVIKILIALMVFMCVMIKMGVIMYGANNTYITEDGNYKYTILEDGTIEINGYLGTETEVVIPSAIEGKKVTSIGDKAFYKCSSVTRIEIPKEVINIGESTFYKCSSLTNIEIPEGVTSIGGWAFEYCSSLTSIKIPEGVTTIGVQVFRECNSLTSIKIPEGVTSIGYGAFDACSSLTRIKIPEGVTSIGNYAFGECSSLTNIEVEENNKNYSSKDGVLFNKEQTELIRYPAGKLEINYTIQENVTSIESYAFHGSDSLTRIEIPKGVTTIGKGAFGDCSSLTSIEIPEGVSIIDAWLFRGCSSLSNIVIPDTVAIIDVWAFEDCNSLTKIVICNKVTSIAKNAFEGCSSVTIYCKSNSSAETYAKKNEIKYIIDDDAPTVESIVGNPTEWTDKDVILTINGAVDNVVGLANNPYSFDGGVTWQKENTKTYKKNTKEIIIKVRDQLGNTYIHETLNITQIYRITSEKYEIGDKYITQISPLTSVSEFFSNIETNGIEVKIYNKNNEEVIGETVIETGMKVEAKIGEKTKVYTIVVKGDLNGDGKADFKDLVKANAYRLGKVKDLEEAFVLAGDLTEDGQVDFKDLVKLNSYRLGKIKL